MLSNPNPNPNQNFSSLSSTSRKLIAKEKSKQVLFIYNLVGATIYISIIFSISASSQKAILFRAQLVLIY